jgi:alcohol dehydrogenase class IV
MITVRRAPRQLIEGPGAIDALSRIVSDLTDRVFVVTDPIIASLPAFSASMGSLRARGTTVTVFPHALADVPLSLVDDCLLAMRDADAGAIVAFGGGSVIDLAKATAVLHAHGGSLRDYYGENLVPGPVLPLVAVPTTAGTGAEVTTVAVLSDPERALKVGVSSVHLIPDVALCDPDLTMTCPPTVTAHSGIDALCHAFESFTATRRETDARSAVEEVAVGKNDRSDSSALEAVELLALNLPRAVEHGEDPDARAAVMRGATAAGVAFALSGVGAPHALQYPMGAATHTPHGLGVGLFLPYVLTANRAMIDDELEQLARPIGLRSGDEVIPWLVDLNARIGIPHELRSLGVAREDLRGLAESAATISRLLRNDRGPGTVESLEAILVAAWEGRLDLLH